MDKIWYKNPSKSEVIETPNDHAELTKVELWLYLKTMRVDRGVKSP